MTVYDKDDVLFGKIEYRRQKIPTARFFLKDSIDVVPDDEIAITGAYTTKNSKIYPATYTFKDDVDGGNPTGWTVAETAGPITVIASFDGHRKVVKIVDSNSNSNEMSQTFAVQADATIEFYMATDALGETYSFFLDVYEGATILTRVAINNDDFEYLDGAWNVIKANFVLVDTFFHVRLVFNDSANTFDCYINGVLEGNNLSYWNNSTTGIDQLKFLTGSTDTLIGHLDAIGYSWDANYNIGDNVHWEYYKDQDSDFESEDVGTSGTSIAWVDSVTEDANNIVDIVPSFDEHKKVLRLYDNDGAEGTIAYNSISRTNGTYEFYIKLDQTDHQYFMFLYDGGLTVSIDLLWADNGTLDYYDGAWHDIVAYSADTWYHIKIAFECGGDAWEGLAADTWYIWIDGLRYGPFNMRGSPVTMDALYFQTGVGSTGTVYIDAISYGWTSGNSEGDNLITTTPNPTYNTTIFDGVIDKADYNANQEIEVNSKAEEIEQIRPSGDYAGYSEVVWGEMLKDASLTDVTINYTEGTEAIEPNEDVDNGGWSSTEGTFYGAVDADDDAKYITGAGSPCQLGFATHTLSTDYNYIIYKVDVRVRAKYNATPVAEYVELYNGTSWETQQNTGNLTASFANYDISFTGLQLNQSDVASFKVRLDGVTTSVARLYITIYYRSYDDFTDPGSYKHSITARGETTLKNYGDMYALIEQQTWYFDAALVLYFNDGDKDTEQDFTETDNVSKVFGTRNIKTYTRVLLKGGYVGGVQLTATSGSGFPVWKDTYSHITDQTQLNNLASSLKTEQSANQYIIQLERRESTGGLYQVGETVTLPASPNQIKFSTSDRLIPDGQYILNKIDYLISNGIYLMLDIEIIDGLMFSNPFKDRTTGTNAENIGNEVSIQAGQMATNKTSIFIKTANPTVNDDVDLNYLVGDFWLNTDDFGLFVCVDNTDGAANWDEITKS